MFLYGTATAYRGTALSPPRFHYFPLRTLFAFGNVRAVFLNNDLRNMLFAFFLRCACISISCDIIRFTGLRINADINACARE